MNIVFAILILGIVVFIHEFGHFIFAKASHIVVEEFSIGMGPRLFSFSKGGTKYSLKLLPIGGSCAMKGEDAEDVSEGSFMSASVWKRMLVVLGGPFFNFVLAFIGAIVLLSINGNDPARIVEVEKDSAAYEAGLREGDLITKFNGNTVSSGREIYVLMTLDGVPEDKITLTVKRDGKKINIAYAPDVIEKYMLGFNYVPSEEKAEVTGLIEGGAMSKAGIVVGDVITGINDVDIHTSNELMEYFENNPISEQPVKVKYRHIGIPYETMITPTVNRSANGGFSFNLMNEKLSPGRVITGAFGEMGYNVRVTLKSLVSIFKGRFGVKDLSGPIGVVTVISDVYEEAKEDGGIGEALLNLLNLVILISVNLGVLNLLPIPALDGCRFLFMVIEVIRRKPISQEIEARIHMAGFSLLMALAVFIAFNDVMKLFG